MVGEPPLQNIVVTWRAVVTANGTKPLAPALDRMNAALGTSIRHDRITEWMRSEGGRKPGSAVYEYMVLTALPHLLQNLPQDLQASTAAALQLPRA